MLDIQGYISITDGLRASRPDLVIETYNVIIKGDTKLPFEPNEWDVILLIDVLHHIEHIVPLMKECYRVANHIIIKDHNAEGLLARAILKMMEPEGTTKTYHQSKTQWANLLHFSGLYLTKWTTELRLYPWPLDYIFGGNRQLLIEAKRAPKQNGEALMVSIVMPCLNEAETLQVCIEKAANWMKTRGINGEIVIADNGSTDGSQALAESLGARVVNVPARGYGVALQTGFDAAKSEFIIMGDSDDSYDFSDLDKFVINLQDGYDYVPGSRLTAGGGTILPGAMPFLHKWIGNPGFTLLAKLMFGTKVHDVYCGIRGFRKSWQKSLGQNQKGMTFAIEMQFQATRRETRLREVPVTLHPDGRSRSPHLKTFKDGWRTLKFFIKQYISPS